MRGESTHSCEGRSPLALPSGPRPHFAPLLVQNVHSAASTVGSMPPSFLSGKTFPLGDRLWAFCLHAMRGAAKDARAHSLCAAVAALFAQRNSLWYVHRKRYVLLRPTRGQGGGVYTQSIANVRCSGASAFATLRCSPSGFSYFPKYNPHCFTKQKLYLLYTRLNS